LLSPRCDDDDGDDDDDDVGPDDSVKCFHCDAVLKNWKPDDSPWTEHARWFPRCNYVRQKREASRGRTPVTQRPVLSIIVH